MANITTKPTSSLIKFVRGTEDQFERFINRENDTLYFIYKNENSTTGKLYLGHKLIGGGTPAELTDLIEGTFTDGNLLVYDANTEKWTSEPIENAVRTMVGATAAADGLSGLTPTPHVGDQTKFLRGDGSWASPSVDNSTIELDDSDRIAIKNFSSAPVGAIPQKTTSGLQWVSIGSVNNSLKYKKVQNLNEVTEEATVYLVPNSSEETNNLFDEYMFIDNKPELIGSIGNINLNNYVTTTTFNTTVLDLQTALANKIDSNNFIALSNRVSDVEDQLTWQELYETNS